MNARKRLVPIEPSEPRPPTAEAVSAFRSAGWGDDSEWLGPLALSVFQGPKEPFDEWAQQDIEVVARSWKESGPSPDRARAMLMAFARLCRCGGNTAPVRHRAGPGGTPIPIPADSHGLEEWRSIAAEFRSRAPDVDFTDVLIHSGWPGEYGTEADLDRQIRQFARENWESGGTPSFTGMPALCKLMWVLFNAANLPLDRVIDHDSLIATGESRWGSPTPPSVPPRVTLGGVRSLSTWMAAVGLRALSTARARVATSDSNRTAAVAALCIRDAIGTWLVASGHHWTWVDKGGLDLAKETLPYFELLHDWCVSRADGEPLLRRAWLWFAMCTFRADGNLWTTLSPQHRRAILRAANEDLSRLRKLLSRADGSAPPPPPDEGGQVHRISAPEATASAIQHPPSPPDEFEAERDHVETCLLLLFRHDGVWAGLKPMLLAWRALRSPGILDDLRYWREPNRPNPPQPWAYLFDRPIQLFQVYVGREQRSDPTLERLRGDVAAFCLERLADRWSAGERAEAQRSGRSRTNDDMVERSPEWRYCLIRAASSLGINPEGKGHRVLKMASELDPDLGVRDAANQAYEQLRRGVTLPEGVSPRRAIMSALWWIRQAHILGLGIQPDPDGAQRTRIKELARTQETEWVDKPATNEMR